MARNPSPPEASPEAEDLVIMGRVAAPYAVRGWVRIHPYTEYLDSLLDYPVWHLKIRGQWQPHVLLDAKVHSQHLLAQLEHIQDRSGAEAIVGAEIAVPRRELPPTDEGEYYWDDLVGKQVTNLAGEMLGEIQGFLETGAHDVMKVVGERERLIPFTAPIVREVDMELGRIVVDWERDY